MRHGPGEMTEADRRKERLAEELRANLQRRRAQARLRREGSVEPPPAPDAGPSSDEAGEADATGAFDPRR